MKSLLLALSVLFSTFVYAHAIDLPKTQSLPFAQLGPAAELPFVMHVPEGYVWVKRLADSSGIIVLCASSDEPLIAESGNFSQARSAVISLRQSSNDHYDVAAKLFSFERSIESDVSGAGGKNLSFEKRDIRGLPVAVVTFEVGERKFYSLAIAKGAMVYRLSYNARGESRDYHDAVWAGLVNGL